MNDELPVIEKMINSLKRDQEEVSQIENTIEEITLEVKKNNDELIRLSKITEIFFELFGKTRVWSPGQIKECSE